MITKSKLTLLLFFGAVLAFAGVMAYYFRQAAQQSEALRREIKLIVYAPKSFIDPFGPGDAIKNQFEAKCACTVEYVDMGGADTAIEKMKLDPKRRVDVVLGIDLLLLQKVFNTIKVQSIDLPNDPFRGEIRPVVFPRFVPYDWSPMGFVYRKGEVQPAASWSEFLAKAPKHSVALEDPELSSAGLEWLYGMFVTQKNLPSAFHSLRRVTETVAPTWSSAYGLFKQHQAKLAFSYLTSLVYHRTVEKDYSYRFMQFQDGHPAQIEYAFVPDSCWNCDSAKMFVRDLLAPSTQKILAEKNYMFPVIKSDLMKDDPLSDEFTKLPKVKIFGPKKLVEFARQQSEIIQVWKNSNP